MRNFLESEAFADIVNEEVYDYVYDYDLHLQKEKLAKLKCCDKLAERIAKEYAYDFDEHDDVTAEVMQKIKEGGEEWTALFEAAKNAAVKRIKDEICDEIDEWNETLKEDEELEKEAERLQEAEDTELKAEEAAAE
ncbi:hypothetical protein AALA22_09050 [Anaerovoracaceae bacterium 41-7]